MAIATLGTALKQIDRLFQAGTLTGLSDAQLLERFVTGHDSAAFETLVARHGPMVLSVCRGTLRDTNDAEDAFQATFLVLVKKAGTIRGHVALGGWLHLVARRIAIEANVAAARRRAHERRAGGMAAAKSSSQTMVQDALLTSLHDEIARLPDKYRLAVVLCDLEGIPQAQAAGHLRWSERTLRRRLAEARDRLKSRLRRLGLETDRSALGALFWPREASLAVPPGWTETAVRAAIGTLSHTITAGTVSTAAQTLTRAMRKTMLFQNLKLAAAAVLAAGGGAGIFVMAGLAVGRFDSPKPQELAQAVLEARTEPKTEPPKAQTDIDLKRVPISGSVLTPDGKPLPDAKIYVRHSHWYGRGEEARAVQQAAATGPDGRFRFELDPSKSDAPKGDGPPWHSAMIAAVAPGFGPSWTTAGEAAPAGAELRLVRDDLPVRGRIVDTQGRPVAGATVRVERIAILRASVQPDAALASGKLDWDGIMVPTIRRDDWWFPAWIGAGASVATDADGRFEFIGLGRDRVAIICVEHQGLEQGRVAVLARAPQGPRKLPPGPSPTFDSLNGEIGLELYGSTFEHVVGPSKPITGVVQVKGTGEPVAGVTVAAQVPGRLWSVVMTTTDEHGHFRLDGLPKAPAYRVDVRAKPGAPYLGVRPQTVADTEGLKPIAMTFELTQAVAVKGRLIDTHTRRAVPCDWVQYFPLPNNPRQGNVHGTSSGLDHTFQITVPAGGGMVVVKVRGKTNPYPAARLAAADRGKIGVQGDGGAAGGIRLALYHAYRIVDFAEGTKSAIVDLEVTPGTHRTGRLIDTNGQPVAGASAMGLTTDPFAAEKLDGANFTINGLRPGESRFVEVRHERRGIGGSVTVTGSEPEDQTIVVTLAPYGTIAGRIFDEDGLPLRGARLLANVNRRKGAGASDPDFRSREAVSDEQGRFRIEAINPALGVSVWVQKPGSPPFTFRPKPSKDLSNLTVKSSETLDLGDIEVRFQTVQ